MTPETESRIIDLLIRILFLGLFVYAALLMVAPLAGLVLWAVILCVAVYPLYEWLSQKLGGRRKLSATILTLVGLAVTIGPVAALATGIIEAGARFAEVADEGKLHLPPVPEEVKNWPFIGDDIHGAWTLANTNLEAALTKFGPAILSAGTAVLSKVAGIGLGLLAMAISVIIMGLLFVPGPGLVVGVRHFANRVFAPQGAAFVDMAGATVRNVSRGVIGVAAIQALLAGIVMVVFGVTAAGPLALLCLVLGIIQVGPGPVIIPVIIWAWTAMSPGMALVFTVLMVPIMLMDNVLRPIFIARGLDTPMLVILVGVLGGMIAYGLIGIFTGPVILAVFYKLLVGWMNLDGNTATESADEAAEKPAP